MANTTKVTLIGVGGYPFTYRYVRRCAVNKLGRTGVDWKAVFMDANGHAFSQNKLVGPDTLTIALLTAKLLPALSLST